MKNTGRLSPITISSPHHTPVEEEALQAALLRGVSRTFALTIPLLPQPLAHVVSNAYLLCRTLDTIEDEPQLDPLPKRDFSRRFVDVVCGRADVEDFAADLSACLSEGTAVMEHELVRCLPRVIAITHRMPADVRRVLERCVRIMSEGMIHFQRHQNREGVPSLVDFNRYCYVVAGVVGEMLTDLFCRHSPATARHRDKLMALAASFGQGLQMTNILKDIWEDYQRGVCWLPRDIFEERAFSLSQLKESQGHPGFEAAVTFLVGLAHAHLQNALQYILHLAPHDTAIRRACLLPIGLALLTLRRIHDRPSFRLGEEVKISRRSVAYTLIITRLSASRNWLLRLLFRRLGRGLPVAEMDDLLIKAV